jgi:predicted nucleic acid-binding protein
MFLPSDPLLEPALRIASKFEIPFIGGLSLAAAVQIDGRLVTADRDFYESFQGTTFAMHVKWVGDIR